MICDLSGVAGRDPLHVNKPAAAVVAHPPPPLVCVVDHKPTTHISSPPPTYWPHHHWLVFRKKDLYLIITQKLKVKCSTFHEMWHFSYENVALFIWNAFSYEMWHFSWNAVLFMWKALCFSYEKHLKSLKTADSTQISHLDLVFHRVQREGHSWKVPLFMWKAPLFMKSAAFRKTTCKEL